MTDVGVRISGGGSLAVDTTSMLAAARVLERAADDLSRLAASLDAAATQVAAAAIPLGAALRECRAAQRYASDAAGGLRTASLRYGAADDAVTRLLTTTAAVQAVALGAETAVLGPVVPLGESSLVGGGLVLALLGEIATTGRMGPQMDPVVLRALRLAVSSSDDLLRGLEAHETPADLAHDDPDAPGGTASLAGHAADLLPRQPGTLRTTVVDRDVVAGPGGLAGLAARVPEPPAGAPQIRIEAYGDPSGGRRFIVYLAGTVSFSPDSGDEPFDARADLEGVAGRPSDSERAVLQAMREAGVGEDDPVLLVGHSQGALVATRIAQSSGLRVAGVVTLGGPTGQIALPEDVPVLAIEHDDDLVPALPGLPAAGEAGRRRIVVQRSAAGDTLPTMPGTVGFGPGLPTHAVASYVLTTALAERSGDPRVDRFRHGLAPFLDARHGVALQVRADRVPGAALRPARPRGAAAAGR
ncbi:lipase family protein [Amnibacterium sp. CER49]|uniref:lipase family protein n=1 Tax=Amnibacterium sp. CER49 TaxID=3039161 RepID=UPI00244C0F4A|nr:lipase family protein [Amnibacterium sp. CER49]MDH2443649.1 lipase family protein [Amnibacterium sp. CER49]